MVASARQLLESVQLPEQTRGVQVPPEGMHPLVTQAPKVPPDFNRQVPPQTVTVVPEPPPLISIEYAWLQVTLTPFSVWVLRTSAAPTAW
jgi:hypothetical protein